MQWYIPFSTWTHQKQQQQYNRKVYWSIIRWTLFLVVFFFYSITIFLFCVKKIEWSLTCLNKNAVCFKTCAHKSTQNKLFLQMKNNKNKIKTTYFESFVHIIIKHFIVCLYSGIYSKQLVELVVWCILYVWWYFTKCYVYFWFVKMDI